MDPTVQLFLMSIAMFVGCYVAGKLPLILQNRESKSQLMSVFGAGMLVGTAFTIIIPEGIRTLYTNCNSEGAASSHPTQKEGTALEADHSVSANSHHHNHNDNEFTIAVSLLLGFLFMLLVDKCASSHHSPGGSSKLDTELPTNASNSSTVSTNSVSSRKLCTATLGLMVHAAADGIALGAAAASHHSDVQFIVFFAIMLHKAPAAFGLTSFLVREGSDTRRSNKLLLLFSVAAPLGAFATYTLITLSGSESMSSSTSTSIAMLFSAGTFLYVATVHIIPELISSAGEVEAGGQLSWKQLTTMILGAFVPLLFSFGHHH